MNRPKWVRGVVPELLDDAVVITGVGRSTPTRPWLPCRYIDLCPKQGERWYCILSTEPPEMPGPELRLPAGWEVAEDGEYWAGYRQQRWVLRLRCDKSKDERVTVEVQHNSRRECIEEINRILEEK